MATLAPDHDPLPPAARTIGMWLFLASLFMLFAAGMVGYILIRSGAPNRPDTGVIQLPDWFAISTLMLIAAGITLERAIHHLRHKRPATFRNLLHATTAFTLAFIALQTPGLLALLATHSHASTEGVTLYGLVFVLILLHALHILGGLIPLAITTYRASQGAYNHTNLAPLRALAMYWHFLDAIWLVMLGMFLYMQ